MTWVPKRLDELGSVSRGRSRHRPRDAAHLYGGPHPFIQTGDVKHAGLYITGFTQTYTEAGLQQSKLWPAGTLCITIAANIADTAILAIDACFPDSVIGFNADPQQSDARFVKYLFDATIKVRAQQFSQGATQDNLSQEKLLSLDFAVPAVGEQTRIADILSTYDDLIDNNRRRMALLEESARLLYREWFVRLRFPGYEHTRIIDGVPDGWARRRIGDIADCVGGGTPSTQVQGYWEDGDITWVTPTDITRNSHLVLLDSEKKITAEGLKSSSAKLVSPHAVLMTSRASVGFFAVAGREVCTNQGFISVVAHELVHSIFLLFQLSERVEEIRSMGSGSTYPEVSRGKFREFQIVVPPKRLAALFDEQATILLKQIRVLKQQNQKLRTARDLLLPRLMSGEIAA